MYALKAFKNKLLKAKYIKNKNLSGCNWTNTAFFKEKEDYCKMPYARRNIHLIVRTWSTNIPGNSHTSQNHSNRLQMHLLPRT